MVAIVSLFIINDGIGLLLLEGLLYITSMIHILSGIRDIFRFGATNKFNSLPCGALWTPRALKGGILCNSIPGLNFSGPRCLPMRRNYSSANSSVVATQPVKIYKNADLDRLRILKESKGKAGVYR